MSRIAIALGSVLLAVTCFAQSPAEVAERERARREANQRPVKVYTNQDLEKAGERGGNVTSPAATGGRAAPRRSAGDGAVSESGPSRESEWRERAAEARAAISKAQARVEQAEREVTAVRQDRDVTGDLLNPNREQDRMRRLEEADQELAAARSAVEEAERSWRELQAEARLEGVPPGWLR